MSIPTYVGAGALSAGSGAQTPALPGSLAVNDILLLIDVTVNAEVGNVATPNGGTWTEVLSIDGHASAKRMNIFWSRYNGTQTAPVTNDSGGQNHVFIAAFRGCKTTGDPFNITSSNLNTAGSTALSATGATTTAANCLVVICATTNNDADNFGATWTNADLASVTQQLNVTGGLGHIGLVTGEKASAGAYGATTNTLTGASFMSCAAIALQEASAAVGVMAALLAAEHF